MRSLAIATFVLISLASFSKAQAIEVVVGAAGDLAFSDNHTRKKAIPPELSPNKVWDWAHGVATLEELTSGVSSLFWASDINFINLETALSPQKRDIRATKEGMEGNYFSFLSHPNSVRHLVETMNVNLFSLANNHMFDFGQEGAYRTEQAMYELKKEYPFIQSSGIYYQDQKIAPIEFYVNGYKVAFAAINGTHGGRGSAYGTKKGRYLLYVNGDEYRTLIQAFKNSDAQLKILSIHYGTEGQVSLNKGQRDRYRYAVDHGGINLILGHHPHVVRPVEVYNGAVIYYSLGNFLITGAANIDTRENGFDYGLFSRTFFKLSPQGATLTAIEATPLKGMHWAPYQPSPQTSAKSMNFLNRLNRAELGSNGVEFKITSEGKGVYCAPGRKGSRSERICP